MLCGTAREHVDAPAPAREGLVDHAYLPLRLVRAEVAHLEPLAVPVREHRPQVALVLDAAGEDGRARARLDAGLLLALGDDDLVLDVVVDHVHLVLLRLGAQLGVRWEEEHDARLLARLGLRVRVDADGGEGDALLVDGGPAFHEVSGNLRRDEVGRRMEVEKVLYAYLDKPHSPIPRIHHKGFVWVWLVILFVSPVDIEPLGILLLDHGRVFHFECVRSIWMLYR